MPQKDQLKLLSLKTARSLRSALFCVCLLSGLASAQTLTETYFIPVRSDDLKAVNQNLGYFVSDDVLTLISIVPSASSTVIYYDHWEDGFEDDINQPTQATTEVWGDTNFANGSAPGSAGDILVAGSPIVLENTAALPRDPNTVVYDGGDRVIASRPLSVVFSAYHPTSPGTFLAGAMAVNDTSGYGRTYISPVGQELSSDLGFERVNASVMASRDKTTVQVDLDADGTIDASYELNMGQNLIVEDLLVGSTITADQPVQVHLASGDNNQLSGWVSRWYTMSPRDSWGSQYCTPIHSVEFQDVEDRNNNEDTNDLRTAVAEIYLYNPHSADLTVTLQDQGGTTTAVIPSGGTIRRDLPLEGGTCVRSNDDRDFYGLTLFDKRAAGHDWGAGLINACELFSQVLVGLGYGSRDLSRNGSPLWVMPLARTRIYIDYDGDPSTGALVDPRGNRYDERINNVQALETLRIYDDSDNNQSGLRVYTLSGVALAGAWGQDPDRALVGNPFLDMGSTILPVAASSLGVSDILVQDIDGDNILSPGDILEYIIHVANDGLEPLDNLILEHAASGNVTYIPNSTSLEGISIPDNTTPFSLFPLDEDGYLISSLGTEEVLTFRFRGQLNQQWDACDRFAQSTTCLKTPGSCDEPESKCEEDTLDVVVPVTTEFAFDLSPGQDCLCPGDMQSLDVSIKNTSDMSLPDMAFYIVGSSCSSTHSEIASGSSVNLMCSLSPGEYTATLVALSNSCLAGYSTEYSFTVARPTLDELNVAPLAIIETDCGENVLPPNPSLLNVTGACGATSIQHNRTTSNLVNCLPGTDYWQDVWKITDACGRSVTVTQKIVTVDTSAPVPSACPADQVVACLNDIPQPGSIQFLFTETCDAAGVTFDVISTNLTPLARGCSLDPILVEYRYVLTDSCGNVDSSCTQRFTVINDTPPLILACPSGGVVTCVEEIVSPIVSRPPSSPPLRPDGLVVQTTCAADSTYFVSITQIDHNANGGGCIGTPWFRDFVYTVTDRCGNSSTCTQRFTIIDDEPPEILLSPIGGTVGCLNDVPDPRPNDLVFAPSCDISSIVVSVDTIIVAGNPHCPGNPERVDYVYTVTDPCGQTDVHTQRFTIIDDEPPLIISCPTGTALLCASELPAPLFEVERATDCNPFSVSSETVINQPGTGCVGLPIGISHIYTITDICGNQSSCTQTFKVLDNEAPLIVSVPAGGTVECFNEVPAATPEALVMTVSCDASNLVVQVLTTTSPSPQGCLDNPAWVDHVYTVTDACAQTDVRTQRFTIVDTTEPRILDCPAGATLFCPSELPEPAFDLTLVEDCNPLTLNTEIIQVGATDACASSLRSVSYIYTVRDICGNSSACTQVFRFVDNEPPLILSCPEGLTVNHLDDIPAPQFDVERVSDCHPVTISSEVVTAGPTQGCQSAPRSVSHIYTITDLCGNSVSCTQEYRIVDTVVPVITQCPASHIVSCFSDIPPPALADLLVEESSPITISVTTNQSGSPAGQGCTTVPGRVEYVYTVRDACGNEAMCTQTILVIDNAPPLISCPPITVLDASPSTCTVAVPDLKTTVSDQCGSAVTIQQTPPAGSMVSTGTHHVRILATDHCGNSTICTSRLVVSCSPDIIVDESSGIFVAQPGIEFSVDPIAPCYCSEDNLPVRVTVLNTGNVALTNVTYTLLGTTSCSHTFPIIPTGETRSATCEIIARGALLGVIVNTEDAEVFVAKTLVADFDTTVPGLPFTNKTVYLDCGSPTPEPLLLPFVADACNQVTYSVTTQALAATGCMGLSGGVQHIYRVSDACGNQETVKHTFRYEDQAPPLLQCPADVVVSMGQGSNLDLTGYALASDACTDDPDIWYADTVIETSFTRIIRERTWTARDGCGNLTSCTQRIEEVDQTPPTLLVDSDTRICFDAPVPPVSINVAQDDRDPFPRVSFRERVEPGSCPFSSSITRIWTATDASGNQAAATQHIFRSDCNAPRITCPESISIVCGTPTTPSAPSVTDDLDPNPSMWHTDATIAVMGSLHVTLRTWHAEDACGNQAQCFQVIETRDRESPAITVPADAIIECNDLTNTATLGFASVTDNCDPAPVLWYEDSNLSDACNGENTMLRTWLAVDASGNMAERVQRIQFVDQTPPTIVPPENVNVPCGGVLPLIAQAPFTIDSCSSVLVHYVDSNLPGPCGVANQIKRTWYATDACGNQSTAVQFIRHVDTHAPTLYLPPNLTIRCDQQAEPSLTGQATADDDCGSDPHVEYRDTFFQPVCGDSFEIHRHWMATDACGYRSDATQIISVVDDVAPALTLLQPTLEVPGNAACQAMLPSMDVAASDNCDGFIEVWQQPPPGTMLEEGIHLVTIEALDNCGNRIALTAQVDVVCGLDDAVESDPENDLVLDVGIHADADEACTATASWHLLGEETLSFCYTVRNRGLLPLRGVIIVDTDVEPMVVIPVPGDLRPGESWQVTRQRAVTEPRFSTASASGFPMDPALGRRPEVHAERLLHISLFSEAAVRPEEHQGHIDRVTVAGTGVIGDRVWIDLAGHGDTASANLEQLGLANVTVRLYQDVGDEWMPLSVVQTSSDAATKGAFRFEGLESGRYQVRIDTGTLPPDLAELAQGLNDKVIDLAPGEPRLDVDFALQPQPTASRISAFTQFDEGHILRVEWTSAHEQDILGYLLRFVDEAETLIIESPLVLAVGEQTTYGWQGTPPSAAHVELLELDAQLQTHLLLRQKLETR